MPWYDTGIGILWVISILLFVRFAMDIVVALRRTNLLLQHLAEVAEELKRR